jgi:hypothetical protein
MKKNAKQIAMAEGLRAAVRPTGTENPSHTLIDLQVHAPRLRYIEAQDVNASHRF